MSCQAINATGLLSGPPPTIPSPACTVPVSAGQAFELDFSNIFAANGGSLNTNKFYSLQIANLNNSLTSNTLSFQNVEFLVSGTLKPALGGASVVDQSIRIWDQAGPSVGFSQGLSNYSTSGTTGTFPIPGFGTPTVRSQASFDLTGPVAPSTLGIAALLNTFAINLDTAGIATFTGAKIRGTFLGSDINRIDGFSAGLAIFDTDPNMGMVSPTTIYGNAFNEVPGPLPIVGAGAAFGWSRRLRKRVKKSSAASIAAN